MNYATLTSLALVGVIGAVTGPAAVLDKLFPLLFGMLQYAMAALLTATNLVMAVVTLMY